MVLKIALLFSAVSFVIFGVSCLISPYMTAEFKRYKLSKYRVLTGILQLLGSVALLLGLKWTVLAILGGSGLALLMLLGFITRIRIRDSFLKSFPSFFYMVLNFVLVYLLISDNLN
jgi:hypothetical protein